MQNQQLIIGFIEESNIMPLLKEQLHTIENIYNLPEGERAKLPGGQITGIEKAILEKFGR